MRLCSAVGCRGSVWSLAHGDHWLQHQQLHASSGVSGANGVIIDAEGVLRLQHFPDPGGATRQEADRRSPGQAEPRRGQEQRSAQGLAQSAGSRDRKQLAGKKPPTEEMQFLAGLTRVRYVFYYPETKDIVLAGPAEGWAADAADHVLRHRIRAARCCNCKT